MASLVNLTVAGALSQPHAANIRLELQSDKRTRRTAKTFIDQDKNSEYVLDGSVKTSAR
jgi:uncharacterized Zn finger protein